MQERVVLLMLDVNRHGDIEHAVLYEQHDGTLQGIIGSLEPDPFGTYTDTVGWLMRALRPASRPARR